MNLAISRVLVTGATGFVGRNLVATLRTRGVNVMTVGGPESSSGDADQSVDVQDESALRTILRTYKPDAVVHLAAVSSVATAWANPAAAIRVNVLGTLALMSAVVGALPQTLVISIGSAEEYGGESPTQRGEDSQVQPRNPYGVSKLAQGLLVGQVAGQHGLRASHVRTFNLVGPGQSPTFVVSDWCSQIAAIELAQRPPVIEVGNVNISRDFLDVRDACDGICSILGQTEPAPVYNLCTGVGTSLAEILETLVGAATVGIDVRVDPQRFRPADVPTLVGNPTRLMAQTGWRPTRPLQQTLLDTLDHWRARVRSRG